MTGLDYITVKGLKSIAAIEKLPLQPINILIGANGSGKSNFIGVFSFLSAVREGRLRDYVTAAGGAERLLHCGSKTTKENGPRARRTKRRPGGDAVVFVRGPL